MKTKRGGREMNPTDAYRKLARKREIKRNKAERTYIREAFGKTRDTSKAGELKSELEELIAIEADGELNRLQKLRKKVVQEAYEVAIRKQKEEEFKKRAAEEEGGQVNTGLSSVPLPKPPPLPAGPKPGEVGMPPPPGAPPLPFGPGPGGLPLLPPPPGPPPGLAAAASADGQVPSVLPPPPGPPPGLLPPPLGPPPFGMLPPPPGPPPGMLPPPSMPPPGMVRQPGAGLQPPPGPGGSSILPQPGGAATLARPATTAAAKPAVPGAGTITGASTVSKRPLAYRDKALTSMVPASVLVRREAASKDGGPGDSSEVRIGPGFGLAPVQKSAGGPGAARAARPALAPPSQGRWGNAVTTIVAAPGQAKPKGPAAPGAGAAAPAAKPDEKLADFMSSLAELGAFD